jgi:penicillin-binding protein 1B
VSRFKYRPKRLLIAGLAAIFIIFALYVVYLDLYITTRFDGRRWDLPAQVYARPLEIYAGLRLQPENFERELRRLGYVSVPIPREAGTYYLKKDRIAFVTRGFSFWDGPEESRAIVAEFESDRISRLTDFNGDVPVCRLEPLMVGSIFPGHGEDRLVVRPDQVPALLLAALKVVEDRRFEEHRGVDPVAVMRAFVANLRAGEVTQGGSTLTQQLIKSYFLTNERTLWRKMREALMAIILEAHFDKEDILNAYINEIYLAQDESRAIHGFGLGSQFYFSKPLVELELNEIALLVALVRGPSYYDPRRHPDRALARRNLVLKLMADLDVVSQAEADYAAARPLGIWNHAKEGASYYPAFIQLVRRQLETEYRKDDLTSEGLKVFTTLDPVIQANAEKVLTGGLARLDGRNPDAVQKLEGAAVITSAQSAEVLAVVGGRRAGFDGFNRALDARRPIGSLAKPVVYLAALQTGQYSLASTTEDIEIEVALWNGDVWRPQNFKGEAHGVVTLIRALVESFNMATVRLGMEVGVERVAGLFEKLGAPTRPPAYPSVLLGAFELAPIDVAQIYNTLAMGDSGVRSEPCVPSWMLMENRYRDIRSTSVKRPTRLLSINSIRAWSKSCVAVPGAWRNDG